MGNVELLGFLNHANYSSKSVITTALRYEHVEGLGEQNLLEEGVAWFALLYQIGDDAIHHIGVRVLILRWLLLFQAFAKLHHLLLGRNVSEHLLEEVAVAALYYVAADRLFLIRGVVDVVFA